MAFAPIAGCGPIDEGGGGGGGGTSDASQCDPGFFDPGSTWTDPKGNSFVGADLNVAARAVYAEASGSSMAGTAVFAERAAVASSIYNRVGNTSFPAQVNGKTLAAAWTFTDVLYSTVPGVQFEAITGPAEKTVKFNNSAPGNYQSLSKAECADLAGSIDAIRGLMLNGPKYGFTTFRGYDPNNGKAVKIGGSYFWTEP